MTKIGRRLFIAGAIGIVVATIFFIRGRAGDIVATPGVPIARRAHILTAWFSKRSRVLEEENESLRTETTKLLLRVAQLEDELGAARHQLTTEPFFARNDWKSVNAEVIGKTLPTEEQFIITRGGRDGVVMGAPVLADGGVFIGTIVAVEPRRALFRSVRDPLSSVAINHVDNRVVAGLARGKHGIGIEVDFLLADTPVTGGELMVTSGLNPGVPAGLVVGTLESVTRSSEDLFVRAGIVQPPTASFPRFVSVLIVKE
ncbi:MAG: rod shape-determining protein MreC [bacterium]|nr:rod shape-determining protein MreC [bacterium]